MRDHRGKSGDDSLGGGNRGRRKRRRGERRGGDTVQPTAGTTFATFEFSGSSCIVKGAVASIAGSILSLVSPQKTEVLKNDLTLEANAKEYHNQAGAFKTAGLTLAGEPATLSGLFLMSLTSDEVFGAF
jgi:hypothetical protein